MSLSGGGVAVMSSFFQCHDKNRDEARRKLEAPDEVQAQRQTQAHPTYVSAGVTMVGHASQQLCDTLVPNQLLSLQFCKVKP